MGMVSSGNTVPKQIRVKARTQYAPKDSVQLVNGNSILTGQQVFTMILLPGSYGQNVRLKTIYKPPYAPKNYSHELRFCDSLPSHDMAHSILDSPSR